MVPFNEGSFPSARGAENENSVFRLPVAEHLFKEHNQDSLVILMMMMIMMMVMVIDNDDDDDDNDDGD